MPGFVFDFVILTTGSVLAGRFGVTLDDDGHLLAVIGFEEGSGLTYIPGDRILRAGQEEMPG
jgi:hypothetical protein